MTTQEVRQMIEEIGLPYAYYEFPDGTQQEPPFVCLFYEGRNDFHADGVNYQKIKGLVIELYTDEPDLDKEDEIEALLTAHGLTYTTTEPEFIGSERMWKTEFTTEIIIDERTETNA